MTIDLLSFHCLPGEDVNIPVCMLAKLPQALNAIPSIIPLTNEQIMRIISVHFLSTCWARWSASRMRNGMLRSSTAVKDELSEGPGALFSGLDDLATPESSLSVSSSIRHSSAEGGKVTPGCPGELMVPCFSWSLEKRYSKRLIYQEASLEERLL